MSLGKKLKEIRDKSTKTEYLSELKKRKVKRTWEDVKDRIEESIISGKDVLPIKLSDNLFIKGGDFVWDNTGKGYSLEYKEFWNSFCEWCISNDLKCRIQWQHDGMGISSWFEVVVEAS